MYFLRVDWWDKEYKESAMNRVAISILFLGHNILLSKLQLFKMHLSCPKCTLLTDFLLPCFQICYKSSYDTIIASSTDNPKVHLPQHTTATTLYNGPKPKNFLKLHHQAKWKQEQMRCNNLQVHQKHLITHNTKKPIQSILTSQNPIWAPKKEQVWQLICYII